MFNPFFARPIGSDSFERHLITQMVKAEEVKNMEKEAIPEVRLILHAIQEPASYDPVDEGYRALATAILARALADYLECYANWLRTKDADSPMQDVYFSRCLVIENEYFRTDPARANLLNYVIKNIVHKDFYIQDRIKTIKEYAHRIECAV